ncbi:MAG: hypothetical protein JJE10_10895 [Thermoleophilia bacterium]|nr:hypothetical protein [Thermoleophilia bacterium]
MGFANSTYCAVERRQANPSARELEGRRLIPEMLWIFESNRRIYDSDKLWHEMKREGIGILAAMSSV